MKKVTILFIVCLLFNLTVLVPLAIAQEAENANIEMADTLRSEGKIYVVVLVVIIIFTGLVLYAVNTERKLTKIEKEIRSLKSPEEL